MKPSCASRMILVLLLVCMGLFGAEEPFVPSVKAELYTPGSVQVTVSFTLGPEAVMHEEDITVVVKGRTPELLQADPLEELDGESVYRRSFRRSYRVDGRAGETLDVSVTYSGCLLNGMCLLPQTRTFTVVPEGTAVVQGKSAGESGTEVNAASPGSREAQGQSETASPFSGWTILDTRVGYVASGELCNWLSDVSAGRIAQPGGDNLLARVFHGYGLLLAMLLVIPLGILLNFTPCVLPMIPVTLAVIGTRDSGRNRGLLLGTAYGLGMAVSYGMLGCLVVLAGTPFGALNGSAWFNGAVASLFLILGLCMFDVLVIDFSRLRSGRVSGNAASHGRLAGAFAMGALAAVLAGACVAPVLLWVLVLSSDLYNSGRTAGMAMPFLLGLGMGLPWPFLGGGLSKLPRPGQWMVRVRQGLGVLIILLGLYYGHVAWRQAVRSECRIVAAADGWETDLLRAAERARAEGKPLFIDFWGISCKNCELMDRTVFTQPDVQEGLNAFVPVKFLADDLGEPMVAAAVRAFDVKGFPTFVIVNVP